MFGCPTVNIGSRQAGRLRGQNVTDADYCAADILATVRRCFDEPAFREKCRMTDNPYYLGDAGKKIAAVLASVPVDQALIRKKMTLVGESRDGWYR